MACLQRPCTVRPGRFLPRIRTLARPQPPLSHRAFTVLALQSSADYLWVALLRSYNPVQCILQPAVSFFASILQTLSFIGLSPRLQDSDVAVHIHPRTLASRGHCLFCDRSFSLARSPERFSRPTRTPICPFMASERLCSLATQVRPFSLLLSPRLR